jgi:endoglucanase
MTPKRRIKLMLLILASVVAVAVVAVAAVGGFRLTQPRPITSATPVAGGPASAAATPTALADSFLTHWVSAGRVIRRDQGGDTVSEGQSYGMLLAVAVRNKPEFTAIWKWTKTHLMRADGSLAWNWDDGHVVDSQPASDGDLEAARALVLAGSEFQEQSLTKAGNALGAALLNNLTVETPRGRILLPGEWAKAITPYPYDPSYAAPAAFAVLAKSSGDPRWKQLETGSAAVTTELLRNSPLPPDWAVVGTDGSANPTVSPSESSEGVRYSFDAARLPVWDAESCVASNNRLAAQLAGTLRRSTSLSAELDLGGSPLAAVQSPIAYDGRAAALAASHHDSAAMADLARSASLSEHDPTYYGAAWAALAPMLLETSRLGGCAPLNG